MRLTDAVKAEILELYGQGVCQDAIGETVGLSRRTVNKYLRSLNIDGFEMMRRRSPWDEDKENQLRELWEAGVPRKAIAALLDVTVYALSDKRQRLGLKPRENVADRKAA